MTRVNRFKGSWSRALLARRMGRLVLLLAVAWAVKPLPHSYELPPPQQVLTSHPKVGVHTRLTDEVEDWKILTTLSMVREMGAPWIVEYFPWAYIEPEPGQYAWDHSDAVMAFAENQGLRVIARLGMVPAWARPDPEDQETTATFLEPDHYGDFAAFVGVFVERYARTLTEIVVWNEPNLSFEWGYQPVDPAGYVALLAEVYPVAHRANPEVIVLAGALAPTLEPPGSSAGLNDLIYLRQMYAAGAATVFDALAAHTYGLGLAPDVSPDEDLINFRRVELLREIMDENGDADKAIYITEAGWNDHPRWQWAVLPSQRVAYTLDAYRWAEAAWPWCPVVAMWMFRMPALMHNYQDYYAFVTPEFEPRAIYTAVQAYTGNAP
ncbi:MAG: beta-galactosidase [Anaerolineae bacterium]|nr:beta-galactosidase [Anaerolineae bacterium]